MAILLATAIVTAVADQASKRVVLRRGLRHVESGRLGWLGLSPAAAVALLAALAVTAVALRPSPLAAIGLGLSLGGAAGNLWDRLRRGVVIDFIVIARWPAFNVADAALVAGLVVVACSAL